MCYGRVLCVYKFDKNQVFRFKIPSSCPKAHGIFQLQFWRVVSLTDLDVVCDIYFVSL